MIKVAKFGGTSLADGEEILRAMDIIRSDPTRQYVVVSAPGKRDREDTKMTDLFYEWHNLKSKGMSTKSVQDSVECRLIDILHKLGLRSTYSTTLIKNYFARIIRDIDRGASIDYTASRGEYLCAKIVARALGWKFVDAKYLISFDVNGNLIDTSKKIKSLLLKQPSVIPGFYGSMPNGDIRTFPRDGSDITGAIIAAALDATVYENWKDVSGLLMADPTIVDSPKIIRTVTYRELRELTYMGAKVFHHDAISPVQSKGIPINILNTCDLKDPGTWIVSENKEERSADIITGVAGKKDFTVITIEKDQMNRQVGFARKLLTILEEHEISFEHMPTSVDTLSLVIENNQFQKRSLEEIVNAFKKECCPESIKTSTEMAMIAVVGRGMDHTIGVAAKVFTSLSESGINARMIDQGSSEISIIVGVENRDCEASIRAIYNAFVK